MVKINIHEAKTHLSKYLRRIKEGETIVLCDRNVPFAEIRPLPPTPKATKRRFGLFEGQIRMAEDFDATNPELERSFEESDLFPNS